MLYKGEQIEEKLAEEKMKDIIKGVGGKNQEIQRAGQKEKKTSPGSQIFKHLKQRTEKNLRRGNQIIQYFPELSVISFRLKGLTKCLKQGQKYTHIYFTLL